MPSTAMPDTSNVGAVTILKSRPATVCAGPIVTRRALPKSSVPGKYVLESVISPAAGPIGPCPGFATITC